jgi:hypothetical protein
MPTAYQSALAVRNLRIARGEVPRGFKFGFTNRQIWRRYSIFAPIWGTVWETLNWRFQFAALEPERALSVVWSTFGRRCSYQQPRRDTLIEAV